MIEAYISEIGVLAPGLRSWMESCSILRGEAPYVAEPLKLDAPSIMSARDRRRSSPSVRLALNVAHEVIERADRSPQDLATVFGSSNGSGLETGLILDALTKPERLVSPTQFHNSVHNSAVGYWCIANSCHQPSSSLACHDFTFAASLLKAVAQVTSEHREVLMTVFDYPFPKPLDDKRPTEAPFAVALILEPIQLPSSQFKLLVDWAAGALRERGSVPHSPGLRTLWKGNAAGRSLPLLEALARRQPSTLDFRYPADGHLEVAVSPC